MTRRSPALVPLAFVVLPLLGVACSTFGSDEPATPPSSEGGASTDPDGGPSVPGTPDRGIQVVVGDPKVIAYVIQGASLALPVKLTRRDSSTGAVDITLTKLPPDLTADPLTIPAGATEGTLTLRAKATSVQGGPYAVDVSAVEQGPQGTGASTKLSAFVRGGHGALDTTFGDKGVNSQLYGSGSEGNVFDARTLKDGSILVVGRAQNNLVLSRFTSAGVLDSTFRGGGTVVLITSQGFTAFDLVEPPSPAKGFIYALQGNAGSAVQIVRLNLDGARDTNFNGTGQAVLDDGSGSASATIPYQIFALPDGRALISSGRSGGTTIAVTRWNANGTRDDTYGASGSCQIQGTRGRMLLRPGGAVFVSSTSGMQGCTASGMLDTSIGTSPDYMAKAGGADTVDIARTPAGGVAFLAQRGTANPYNPYIVWNRLTPMLDKDASVGSLGDVYTGLRTSSTFLIQDDGGVLIGVPDIGTPENDQVKVLRFTSKGVLDTAFGTAGTASYTISGGAQLTKLVAQPDGRVLALGKSDLTGFDAAMARFWP